MIRSLLKYAEHYYCLGRGVRRAFEYIASTDFSSMKAGRYDVEGNRIYALLQERDSLPLHLAPFENHHRYLDLQTTQSGEEWLGYCPIDWLTPVGPYNAETDVQLYSGTGSLQRSYVGSFAIFFPEDGHQPYVTSADPKPLRKLVMRIALETLK